eukprot:TRINITY_DN528_c0_g2_i1.p1 TRINITY_DN528_c0_g2~~TRINITY_DN528_c0_g2_i1.p1  ORF type:complete len:433 (-),score=107.77 TRINITY_DN528_c0_g2_i1:35-1219(-)
MSSVTGEKHVGKGFGTLAIHAGQPADPQTGAVMIPISLSTTFHQASPGVNKGYEYSRSGNPTRAAYEELIAQLEGGRFGLAFASGSATTATVIAMFTSGDHIITVDDVYGGTNRYFNKVSTPHAHLQFSFVDLTKEGALEAAWTDKTKAVWIETPTNPTLKVVDIERAAEIAHKRGAIVIVDNTFMTPYFQRPLSLGADIVVHSVTKYINGHSDVVGGAAVTSNEELYKKLKFLQNAIGAIPSPFDSFLVLRGAKTLHIRMREHEKNAIAIARFLEKHEKIDRVAYPGLESHPQHDIAKRQQRGYGGMITFWLKGGLEQSRQFLEHLQIFACAESLGGVESLAEHPAIMTHASVAPEDRAKLGISDSLCRLSVGIEDLDDLLHDLVNALNHVKL